MHTAFCIFVIIVCSLIIHFYRINIMPQLPILTKSNKNKYLQWHMYYEKIYGEKIHKSVNLNSFDFFYNNDIVPYKPRILHWFKPIRKNEIWMFANLSYFGYFVRRNNDIDYDSDTFEVMRINVKGTYIEEKNCVWFYITKGSGIFLSVKGMNKRLILQDRRDPKIMKVFGEKWGGLTWEKTTLHKLMYKKKIDLILFLATGGPDIPRAELIVLNPSRRIVETCPALKFFKGSHPCDCDNSLKYLNCR